MRVVVSPVALAARVGRLADAGLDLEGLREAVLEVVFGAVPADAWCWSTTDPATLMITASATHGIPPSIGPEFFRIELTEPDFLKLAELPQRTPPVGTLWAATGGELAASTRWRRLFGPLGLGDELRAAFICGRACWGYLSLHRRQGETPFSPEEVEVLATLGPLVARGIRNAHVRAAVEQGGSRAVVLLAADQTAVAVSPEAEALLVDLEPASRARQELPAAVYAAVGLLQAGGNGVVTAVAASGAWLVVRASPLRGGDAGWTVVTVERASAGDARRHILESWGLTRRESEVAELVLQGASTRRIAADLYISPHTVQQHLKAIFEKSGVRSRRDLIARVMSGARGSGARARK